MGNQPARDGGAFGLDRTAAAHCGGMLLQGVSISAMLFVDAFAWQAGAMVGLGIGTAMVYPTLLAVIGDVASPAWRSTAVGIYRLWRDGGYVVGALLAGALADALSISWAIGVIAALTLLSGGRRPLCLRRRGRTPIPFPPATTPKRWRCNSPEHKATQHGEQSQKGKAL